MLILSLFFSFHSLAIANSPMSCQAIYRTLDEKNNTVERSAHLPARALGSDFKHELDFEGKFFSLTEEKATGDLFAQITTAPQYDSGAVVRGAANSQGVFSATEVLGFTIYRLECSRGPGR